MRCLLALKDHESVPAARDYGDRVDAAIVRVARYPNRQNH
ncbi:Uncharacterised protein [Vibrio cholerae]|nr:Uncharacterised protein [Vibrio cholerae]